MKNPELTEQLEIALRNIFGENKDAAVIISRVPMICKEIKEIHENIKEMNNKFDSNFVSKDSFWPVKTFVYGLIGLILTAVIGMMLSSAFGHPITLP